MERLSDYLVFCDMDNTLLTAKEGIPACNRSVNLPRHKGGAHQRHGNAWVAIAVHLPSPNSWQQ